MAAGESGPREPTEFSRLMARALRQTSHSWIPRVRTRGKTSQPVPVAPGTPPAEDSHSQEQILSKHRVAGSRTSETKQRIFSSPEYQRCYSALQWWVTKDAEFNSDSAPPEEAVLHPADVEHAEIGRVRADHRLAKATGATAKADEKATTKLRVSRGLPGF